MPAISKAHPCRTKTPMTSQVNPEDPIHTPFADPQGSGAEYDSDSDLDDEVVEIKEKSRRPRDNNFQQQRLRAFNPVFTAKSVIPMLFVLAVFFVPLGVGMWYASYRVQDFTIDYTQCENLALSDSWSGIPDEYTTYRFRSKPTVLQAQWKLESDDTQLYDDEKNVCKIQFHVPHDLSGPLYFFYRLEKFHQNHRRYVKLFSEDQLNGKAASVHTIKDTTGLNCQPLSVNSEGKRYYPCGLIANSFFNDTFGETLAAANGTSSDYKMTDEGISWSTTKNRFKKTKYLHEDIVPPPNWVKRFPDGYNSTNVPDISTWGQFQNWMFTSALPNFNKLALRNDDDTLKAGVYEVTIGLHFPVLPFKGKKMIYISQRSVIGGKNYFLGFAWIAGGGVCLLLALVLLAVNTVRPRKAGDRNLLSWVKEQNAKDEIVKDEHVE